MPPTSSSSSSSLSDTETSSLSSSSESQKKNKSPKEKVSPKEDQNANIRVSQDNKKKQDIDEHIAPGLTSELSHVSIDLDQALQTAKQKGLHPIQLHFKNLNYSVLVDSKKQIAPLLNSLANDKKSFMDRFKRKPQNDKVWKKILASASGVFQPGTLTAIMGSSGAGKTTLLNVLAGRVSGGIVEGEVFLNGIPKEKVPKHLKRRQAYVMQDDIMLSTMTPREIITFSANLRLPKNFTEEMKQQRIEEVLEELNLRKCENTPVGAPGLKRGVSGGERKRVSIGVELVTNPSLLFLDEPTTGLDSFTAQQVVSNLRSLAASGRTIVCTIHQPNSQIFHMFDNLILLTKGRIIYNGPTRNAMSYFSSIGVQPPSNMNPADWFMDILHLAPNDQEGEGRVQHLIDSYEGSKLEKKNIEVEHMTDSKLQQSSGVDTEEHGQTYPTQTRLLIARGFKHLVREPLKLRAVIGQVTVIGLIMGLVYLQKDNSQDDVQDKLGAMYFVLVGLTMAATMGIVNTFPREKVLFFREIGGNMYSPTAYWIAQSVLDLPVQIICPILEATIVYWMVGFQTVFTKYLIFVATAMLCMNIGGALGLTLGVVAPDPQTAVALVPVFILPLMLFNGFTITVISCPVYFIWLIYISFLRWAFQILVLNEYKGVTLTCSEDQQIGGQCRLDSGDTLIDNFGLNDESIGLCFAALVIFYVCFKFLSYLALRMRAKQTIDA